MTSPPPATTRLHITPLDAELLPLVLPASIRPLAADISFHEIPTFPENNYGYVTLPIMEADKIKKKLNGSILKGRKFKVESARPLKRQRDEEDGQNNISGDKPSSGKSKKHKAEDNVLDGYELPSDRKVKRGWTESTNDKADRRKKEKKTKSKDEKSAKSQSKSKYTEKAECLFRTKVPPNKASPEPEKSKKKSKKSSQESVVHEFSKTTKHPTFLRSDDGDKAVTSTFDQDKGWIDEAGELKEPASERIRKDQYRPGQVAGHKEKPKKTKAKLPSETEEPQKGKGKSKSKRTSAEPNTVESESEDWTSSSGSSSSGDDSSDSESAESEKSDERDESALSDSSSQTDASDVDAPQQKKQHLTAFNVAEEKEQEGQESSPESKVLDKPTEVHPLEALFKKPAAEKKPDSEPPAQFSFFGQGDEDSEDEMPANIAPLTPFTKRDLQDRGLRSAAPTPDTSQVTKTINWNPSNDSETSLYTDSPVSKLGAGPKDESDFAKWFWENRGDNNRAWKKRRRDAAKEQRQRENRRKGMKGKS
ncbi:hypothetical protein BJX63DRAFT_391452 [Aspergillus granulosus]|uniref:Suppressor protein SRP40 n=1 Tax=Aspergillus granulosus TaxID=176169 RepID=A0ABR4HH01_9EURO